MLPSFLRSRSESEDIFIIDQIMRVVVIMATASNYYSVKPIIIRTESILTGCLVKIKLYKNNKFPMLRKLKYIIKSFMKSIDEFNDFPNISKTLLKLANFIFVQDPLMGLGYCTF